MSRKIDLFKIFNINKTDYKINKTKSNIDYSFFDLVLPLMSEEKFAEIFYQLKPNDYIYNQEHKTWFYYAKNNILKSSKREAPIRLNNEISKTLQSFLDEEYKKINNDPKYNNLYITNYKKVGSTTFSKNIIIKLMNYYNDEDIFNKVDKNKYILAFKDCLYDLKINEYRPINKKDYICNHIKYNLKPEKKTKN